MRSIFLAMLLAAIAMGGEPIVVDLSKMKGSDVVIQREPLTNLVLNVNTSDWYTVTNIVTLPSIVITNGISETVKSLAKSGEICKVFDHCWLDGRVGEDAGYFFADYHPNTLYRHCKICGKGESSLIGVWK